nr:PREDICTED: protein HIDE1 [Apteryx mantelli mantelli]
MYTEGDPFPRCPSLRASQRWHKSPREIANLGRTEPRRHQPGLMCPRGSGVPPGFTGQGRALPAVSCSKATALPRRRRKRLFSFLPVKARRQQTKRDQESCWTETRYPTTELSYENCTFAVSLSGSRGAESGRTTAPSPEPPEKRPSRAASPETPHFSTFKALE